MDPQYTADSIISTTDMTIEDCLPLIEETVEELTAEPVTDRDEEEVRDMAGELIAYTRLFYGAYKQEMVTEQPLASQTSLSAVTDAHLNRMDQARRNE